jgi:hypothetical protein
MNQKEHLGLGDKRWETDLQSFACKDIDSSFDRREPSFPALLESTPPSQFDDILLNMHRIQIRLDQLETIPGSREKFAKYN